MKNANDFFRTNNGSENFFRHPLSPIVYTSGVQDLLKTCKAYWLLDLILSYQIDEAFKSEPFQVWDLQRAEGNSFTIIVTDGNHNRIASQEIPFSDFPYDLATIWLVGDTILLPTEY